MYNIALSFAAGLVVFLLTSLWLGPIPAVLPGLLVTGVAMFLLTRRVGQLVEAEMMQLMPLLQERKIAEAEARIRSIKQRYGRWQVLLSGQMDAQLGMIDYLQMKFDDALPKLQSGKFRNWTALVCIGAIHNRRGQTDEALKSFEAAADAAPKEAIVYLVWATLAARAKQRAKALEALDRGIKALPEDQMLKDLQKTIANKKTISTKHFPQTWYQFFPEELAQQMMMRGRRGPAQAGMPQMPQAPRIGARHAPRR